MSFFSWFKRERGFELGANKLCLRVSPKANMYFADSFCACQKGTNENLNGLLRGFYTKGCNLDIASEKTTKKSGVN